MSRPNIKHGVVIGTGAAINVQLGWVPHSVEVWNASDGDLITTAFLTPYIMQFTAGGVSASSPTIELVAGSTVRGITSGATAKVSSVMPTASTWSAGTAAGFFTLEEDTYVGTFTAAGEYAVITNLASGLVTTSTQDATYDLTLTAEAVGPPVTGLIASTSIAVSAAAAGVSTTSMITRYAGVSGSASKGFTIGSVVSESGKILRYRAFRGDVI